jgi:hypothetical protein
MMAATLIDAIRTVDLSVTPNVVLRGLAAGVAWGVVVALGLCGLHFRNSGIICLGDVVNTLGLSVAGGVLIMLPLAVLARRETTNTCDAARRV